MIGVSARAAAHQSGPCAVLKLNAGGWKMVLRDVLCG